MAEIKNRKKRNTLPWIFLGLGILTLVLYFFVSKNKGQELIPSPASSLIDVRKSNSIVTSYILFIRSDTNVMSLDHSFTNEALLKLTDATKAIASVVDYDVKEDLDKVKEYARKITNDPFETTHADNIRRSADILSSVLRNIQEAKYPNLTYEVAEVNAASAAIIPEKLALDQQTSIKGFFSKAANLLQKMN